MARQRMLLACRGRAPGGTHDDCRAPAQMQPCLVSPTLRWQSKSPFCFELGDRLLILLPAPIDVAAPVYGRWRPEQLVQTIVEQCVLAVVLFGQLTGRRHRSQVGSALTVVLAGSHGFSRWQSRLQDGASQILSNVLTAVQLVPAGASRPRFLRQLPACSSSTGTQHRLVRRGPQIRQPEPASPSRVPAPASGRPDRAARRSLFPDLANCALARLLGFSSLVFLPSEAVGHPSTRPPRVGHAAPRARGPWLGHLLARPVRQEPPSDAIDIDAAGAAGPG